METRQNVVELRIPCDPRFLSVARLTVAGIAARAEPEFSVDDVEDLKISVTEACTNVIDHAYPEECADTERVILVRCTLERGGLTIEVRDDGCGFDLGVAAQTQDEELPKESGLGIPLMRKLMDEVEFTGGPGQGTRVRLHKRPAR
jgi:serine/threonine-protein kinase RsbW